MDEATLAKVKELTGLFDEREGGYKNATKKIFDFVAPTVLAAMYDLFDAPYENVTWLEVQATENILMVVASVVYREQQKVPEIIEQLSPRTTEGSVTTARLFRVGVPVDIAFTTKEGVAEYLTRMAQASINKRKPSLVVKPLEDANVPVVNRDVEFDTSGLSKEQMQQLLLFQSMAKGVKH